MKTLNNYLDLGLKNYPKKNEGARIQKQILWPKENMKTKFAQLKLI